MTTVIEDYRAATDAAPTSFKRWHLRGAGLESLSEESVGLREIAPDELLVRHDACGICFSDIKIINLGPEHPRLIGRDMVTDPVVMGHEVALTIVKVGASIADKFTVGERFIVQADVYYKGANLAYGYVLDGGMAQYGIVGDEVLRGDEGCYLLPLEEETGYVEAALVEPWACVVAAYEYNNYREGVKPSGKTLVYHKSPALGILDVESVSPNGNPATWATIDNLEELATDVLYDDIIIIGTPTVAEVEELSTLIANRGIMNIGLDTPLSEQITIDIGRVHYEQRLYIGGAHRDRDRGGVGVRSEHAYRTAPRRDCMVHRRGRPDGANAHPACDHA